MSNWYSILCSKPFRQIESMQLNWLYFCGICQRIPLKVWPNTALDMQPSHQFACPTLQPLPIRTALVPNATDPEGMTRIWRTFQALCSDRKPTIAILAPTQSIRDPWSAGFKIISGDRYTTTVTLNRWVNGLYTYKMPNVTFVGSDTLSNGTDQFRKAVTAIYFSLVSIHVTWIIWELRLNN